MSSVSLARLALSDREDFLAEVGASTALHGDWVSPPADAEAFDAWYGRTLTGPTISLVARESSGALVGVINASEIVWGAFRSAYLGYYAFGSAAGRGLMTEAMRLACVYLFEEIGLHRLEANIQPDNAASLALVRKAGFLREGFSPRYLKIAGEWRDHERWALLAPCG